MGEHRQPTGIRERLEPLLVAFLAGLGLGHAWGAGVLDPGKHDIPEMHQPPGGSRTPAPLGRTSQLTASDAGVGGAGATTRAQQSNTDQQISLRNR